MNSSLPIGKLLVEFVRRNILATWLRLASAIKSIRSIAPLLDRILVQRIKPEAKTATGIFLPETAVKELNEAKVLAVGPGMLDKDGKRVTPSVQPGDKVLIPQFGGSPIKVGEEELSLFRDHELLAKINE
ncbi:10 kda heat shock protein [Alternaria burnsii]|uniref:10 kDa heat shock protein n=1 Tax=Alternaria burnsii TaxID=1187904 RepID=A0A8H7EIL9_9PLEO|nr:10 kda heat shock protein [Alternaria burnsii]KAF7677123.1 10 kda heat shock protein [Alternaria burnsii]